MKNNAHVSIGNTEMFYVAFGKGEKKLVVLPGLSDGLATVKGRAFFLSLPFKKFLRDYTIYIFSRKENMPEGYSIRDMAEDQALAMKNLGINQAYLLGVSQGGMIAQYMAIDHPETVTKLILAFTAPNANAVVEDAVSGWINMAECGNNTALMIDTAEKTYSEKYLQKKRFFLPILANVSKPKTFDRFLKNARAILGFDCRFELPKISCPTFILAGGDDHIVGSEAALELNRAITGSELFIYDGLGHGAFDEAKDFYARVLEFCNH